MTMLMQVKKLRHPSVADTRPFDPRSHVAQLHAPESPVLEVIPSPVLEHGNRVSSQDKKQLFFWAFLDFLKIPNGKHIIPNYHPNTQLISLEISSTHGIPPTAPRMSCALMILGSLLSPPRPNRRSEGTESEPVLHPKHPRGLRG